VYYGAVYSDSVQKFRQNTTHSSTLQPKGSMFIETSLPQHALLQQLFISANTNKTNSESLKQEALTFCFSNRRTNLIDNKCNGLVGKFYVFF
jgi:hypothetical protein